MVLKARGVMANASSMTTIKDTLSNELFQAFVFSRENLFARRTLRRSMSTDNTSWMRWGPPMIQMRYA